MRLVRTGWRRAALFALAILLLGLQGCSTLFNAYHGYELVDRYIRRDRGDRTTRIVYAVQTTGEGNAVIAGARIELYALKTGGDPANVDDLDTVADALRETNGEGEAVVYVKSDPNEAGDNVIRPWVTYREVITAPGFESYSGVRGEIDEKDGLIEADPIRLVPR